MQSFAPSIKSISITTLHKEKVSLEVSLNEAESYLNLPLDKIHNLIQNNVIELTVPSLCAYKFKLFNGSKTLHPLFSPLPHF